MTNFLATVAVMSGRGYHHGDLRRAVLAAAAEAIEEVGVAGLSLRDLARRAGVSHAAPAYHFGDKAGLLAALAAEGFDLLTEALAAAGPARDPREAGVAYVRFAVAHPAHFAVMFRPDLYADDEAVAAARDRAGAQLSATVQAASDAGSGDEQPYTRIAAWSFVHGFATLWLSGALPDWLGPDAAAAAQATAQAIRLGPTP